MDRDRGEMESFKVVVDTVEKDQMKKWEEKKMVVDKCLVSSDVIRAKGTHFPEYSINKQRRKGKQRTLIKFANLSTQLNASLPRNALYLKIGDEKTMAHFPFPPA